MAHDTQTTSILIIEDEEVTLELLSIVISKKYPDVSIHTASNGSMGLELYRTYSPDIVITDINMPKMDGMQMAEKIRSIKPETKIVVITGRDGDLMPLDSKRASAFDHIIVKPVVFQELFDAIGQCLEGLAR